MAKGIKMKHAAAKAIFFIAGIATIGFVLACAAANQNTAQQTSGMYSMTGWKGQNIQYDKENNINVGAGIDIDGKVGHRLFVEGCHAECVPGPLWTAHYRIVSGNLPPGMDFAPNASDITGVPTESGHWIVQVELYDVLCNDKNYVDVRQELRFHISGTGKVVY